MNSDSTQYEEDQYLLYTDYSDNYSIQVLFAEKEAFEILRDKISLLLENECDHVDLGLGGLIGRIQISSEEKEELEESEEPWSWNTIFAAILFLTFLAAGLIQSGQWLITILKKIYFLFI